MMFSNSLPIEIDYDINKYNVNELESLLSLTKPYTEDQLKDSCSNLFNKQFFTCPVNNQRKLREFIAEIPNVLKEEIRIVIHDNMNSINSMNGILRNEIDPISTNNMNNNSSMNNTLSTNVSKAGNTNNKWVNIDSRFRKNYFNTPTAKFQVQLPSRINKAISMELDSIQVPATYYSINSVHKNNYFLIVINNAYTLQVLLPDGNYSIDELILYLNETVFSKDWDANVALHGNVPRQTVGGEVRNHLIAKYLTSTGKIVIALNEETASPPTDIKFDFMRPLGSTYNNTTLWSSDNVSGDIQTKLGWMLGYRNANYSGSTAYVGEAPIDVSGPRYIYLVVDDYQNNSQEPMVTALAESQLSKNILAKIPVNNPLVGTNHFNNITLPLKNKQCERRYLRPVDIETLNVSLMDDYGRPLVMNSDWNCTLVLSCIYEV